MAAGLSLPLRAVNGRAALDAGEDQLKKIIAMALSDCDNGNPFQEDSMGIDPTIVFSLNDVETQAFVRRRIIDKFKALEVDGRARLDLDGFSFDNSAEEGELVCTIRYINLETTAAEELELRGASVFELFRSITTKGAV